MLYRKTTFVVMIVCLALTLPGAASAECTDTVASFAALTDELDVIGLNGADVAGRLGILLIRNDGVPIADSFFLLAGRSRLHVSARDVYAGLFIPPPLRLVPDNTFLLFQASPGQRFSLTVTHGAHSYQPQCVTNP